MSQRFPSLASFRSPEEFQQHIRSLASGFDCDLTVETKGALAQPISVYDRTIGNRFAIHPMEGWDGTLDGKPTENTRRRWTNFGASGAKLIWGGEAVAVRHDGRANPNQLFINPENDCQALLTELRQVLVERHESDFGTTRDLLIGLQITHSGRFARPNTKQLEPKIAYYHPLYSQKYNLPSDHPILSDDQLKEIRDAYIVAAEIAQRSGFDFVDIKACHAYLIHELLSAHTRPGQYGGSFENRTRLFTEIVEGIRAQCPKLQIAVRLGLIDLPPFSESENGQGKALDYSAHLPWRFGFGMNPTNPMEPDFDEPFQFLGLLQSLDIHLVNISVGTPYGSPHLQRPATFPPSDGYLPPVDPLLSVYQQLQVVRKAKAEFPNLKFVGSGYSYLQDYLPNVAQHEIQNGHTDFVGLGRMVLSYPTLPRDVLQGKTLVRKKICRTFSDCTTGPRNNLISGCFPLDNHYKQMPEAAIVKLKRRETIQRLNSAD